MKKIINQPETLVREMGSGMVMAHPELAFDRKYKIIAKKALNGDKVTLISGGGSGHEHAHAGFVGQGMLDAAVGGGGFASPAQMQVAQALRSTAGRAAALLLMHNHRMDMQNLQHARQ
ncbi:dihydroxyacetone kinase, partial [Paenibacillus riograndensis]